MMRSLIPWGHSFLLILGGFCLPAISAEDLCREDLTSLNHSIDEEQLHQHLESLARFALDEVQKPGQPSSARTGLNEDLEKKLHDLAERSGQPLEDVRKGLLAAKQRVLFSSARRSSTSTRNSKLRQELDQIAKKFGLGFDLRAQTVLALSFGTEGLKYAVQPTRKEFAIGSLFGTEDRILSDNYDAKKAAFSRNGSRMASTTFGDPTTILIWDAMPGGMVATLKTLKSYVSEQIQSFQFSPDASRLVGHDSGDRLLVWNLARKSDVPQLIGNASAISFGSDGTLAVAAENKIVLWNTDQLHREYRGPLSEGPKVLGEVPEGRFSTIAVSPNGKKIAATYLEGMSTWRLAVIDVEGKTKTQKWEIPNRTLSLAFSSDGMRLAAGFGGRVLTWNAADGTDEQSLSTVGGVLDLGFSPDGEILFAASDGGLRAWYKVDHGFED